MVLDVGHGLGARRFGDDQIARIALQPGRAQRIAPVLVGIADVGKLEVTAIVLAIGWIVVTVVGAGAVSVRHGRSRICSIE